MEPATMVSRTADEQDALASAARESVRRQMLDLLSKRGVAAYDVEPCPRCGEG